MAPGHHSAKIKAYPCARIASRGTFLGAPIRSSSSMRPSRLRLDGCHFVIGANEVTNPRPRPVSPRRYQRGMVENVLYRIQREVTTCVRDGEGGGAKDG